MSAAPDPWWRRPCVHRWGLVGLAVLPVMAATISVAGRTWYSSADHSLELLRIADVGTRHTPVLGAYSRWGWAHPGPLLFWALAPFWRIAGDTGVLIGTGILNALAVGGLVLVGHRRGGVRLAALVTVMVLLLEQGMGLGELVDPWNPWLAFLPFVLFVALAWSVMCRDWKLLPVGAAVGSYVVQTHAGYLLLVGGLAVTAVAGSFVRGAGDGVVADDRAAVRRAVIVGAVVGAALWAVPVGQQVFGRRGNLGLLLSYARHPADATAGWRAAFGAMGAELRPWGPWIAGSRTFLGFERYEGVLVPCVVLAAVTGLAVLAWRRGHLDATRLAALVVVGTGLAVYSSSRVTGIFVPYVLRWWWAVAAFATLSIAWSATVSIRSARLEGAVTAAAALSGVLLAGSLLVELPAPVPHEDYASAVEQLAPSTQRALDPDQRYLITSLDARTFDAVQIGVYYRLAREGIQVFAPRHELAHLQYGGWRLADPDEVDQILTVVDNAEASLRGYTPLPGARVVAAYDPLSRAERARASQLEAGIRRALGLGVDEPLVTEPGLLAGLLPEPMVDQVAELRRLQDRGEGFTVYVAPTQPGPP